MKKKYLTANSSGMSNLISLKHDLLKQRVTSSSLTTTNPRDLWGKLYWVALLDLTKPNDHIKPNSYMGNCLLQRIKKNIVTEQCNHITNIRIWNKTVNRTVRENVHTNNMAAPL